MNKDHIKKYKSLLKDNSLKSTSARLALLNIFEKNKQPLAVKDLSERLGETGIDTVTLYRNVESLEKAGVLKKIFIDENRAYYELNSAEHHHHLVCKVCGKISDVGECNVTISGKGMLKTAGFAKIIDHSLEFFGICNSCNKK